MKLSERLECMLSYARRGGILADIGCDHGKLCAEAVARGVVQHAIAVDISQPSLQKARELADELGLEELLETRLGDGLEKLESGEADTIVIAGMSGWEISGILEAGRDKLMPKTRLILQPMQRPDILRLRLMRLDIGIVDERLILENDRFFDIIVASGEWDHKYDPCNADVGHLLYLRRDAGLLARVDKKLEALRNYEQRMIAGGSGKAVEMAARILRFEEMRDWLLG